jgi:S1-C subfamily serine protease
LSLTHDLRKRLERNTGVVAQIVVQGTPAFRTNILEGDVLLKIGGADIIDVAGFAEQLNQFAGRTVAIDLLRDVQLRSTANRPMSNSDSQTLV